MTPEFPSLVWESGSIHDRLISPLAWAVADAKIPLRGVHDDTELTTVPESLSNASHDAPPGSTASDDAAEPPESVSTPGLSSAVTHCDIDLTIDTADCDPPLTGWLIPALQRVTQEAGVETGRMSLRVVDDREMASLHQRYSNVPGTTDVLTFDLRDDPVSPADPIDGDIVICLDEANRQAQARGHDTRIEALLYAVHGLLHLLGEDDHADEDYARMHRREDELLSSIGLGPVFARAGKGAAP